MTTCNCLECKTEKQERELEKIIVRLEEICELIQTQHMDKDRTVHLLELVIHDLQIGG